MGHGDDIMRTVASEWYIESRTPDRWIFNERFRVRPGVLSIPLELVEAVRVDRLAVMVEPHTKGVVAGRNKDWGWENWRRLAKRSPFPLVQCSPDKRAKPFLPGVRRIVTPTFLHACAVLLKCRGLVTTEGGLHHAAGALGKPAVVIFGAFNSPRLFGYDFHINLEAPDPECLGQRKTHPACIAAMKRITVDQVLEAMARAFPADGQEARHPRAATG